MVPRVVSLTVLAAVLALPQIARAAPLAGTVLDGDTLAPVPGATVEVVGTAQRATADAAGRFQFADLPPGTLVVRVSAPGYSAADVPVDLGPGGVADLVIILAREGAEAAGETIEIVGKAPRIVDAPGETELDRRELVKLPGTRGDSMQVVKSLPGVANADAAGSGPGLLVIRGAAPEDSLFLVDGVQIPLVYHFFGLQSVLPSEFIDDIEFLPGGFGAEEGRATGGIVHIHTRPSRATTWTGFAELSFINLAGYVEGPLSREHNLTITAAARRSLIDAILPAAIPDDIDLSFTTAPRYYDGQLRIDWQPSARHRFTALGLVSSDVLELLLDEENANDPEATGTFFNQTVFSRVHATWRYDRPAVSSTAIAAVGTRQFRVEVGQDNFLDGDGGFVEVREDVTWRAHPRVTVRAGADIQAQRGTFRSRFPLPPQEGNPDMPNLTTDPPVDLDLDFDDTWVAGYVAADVSPVPAARVTPGVRWDYYDRIGAHTVSPRLQAKVEVAPRWAVLAALGQYSRPLDQAEAVPRDLSPEIAYQYVLGGEHDLSDAVRATGSVFYTDRRRLVVQDRARAGDDPLDVFVNQGYGRSFGAEALVRARTDHFFGWVAYTLSRSDRVDGPGQPRRLFDYDQTHNFIAVASWQVGAWTFGGRWQYTTGEPITPIVGSVFLSDLNVYAPVFGEVNSDRLEDAHQLDVRVDRTWSFRTWKLSAYLDITNVYAHARTLGYQYSFDYQDREAFTTLPIFPAIGVRGTF